MRRLKQAKREAEEKPKRGVDRETTKGLIELALREGDIRSAANYCITFAFLLRPPSELARMKWAERGPSAEENKEAGKKEVRIWWTKDVCSIWFKRRKCKKQALTITRYCWCGTCRVTCPVHALPNYLQTPMWGESVFPDADQGRVRMNRDLKRRCKTLGLQEPSEITMYSFRRGHAREIAEKGGSLGEVLRAGTWASSAFKAYQEMEHISRNATRRTHRKRKREGGDQSLTSGSSDSEGSSD